MGENRVFRKSPKPEPIPEDLIRAAPQGVHVSHCVLQTLRIHGHQVHDFSSGALFFPCLLSTWAVDPGILEGWEKARRVVLVFFEAVDFLKV